MEEKTDRWAFTLNTQPVINLKYVKYMVYQREKGERTEYLHWQGYVEFFKPYTGKYVKSLFKSKTIHIKPANKPRINNLVYCTKEKTRDGEVFLYDAEPAKEEVGESDFWGT